MNGEGTGHRGIVLRVGSRDFYLAVTMAVNSLNLKFCVDAEQRGMALDYGKARAAGSLAFVLISALLGLLLSCLLAVALPPAGALVFFLAFSRTSSLLSNHIPMGLTLMALPLPNEPYG